MAKKAMANAAAAAAGSAPVPSAAKAPRKTKAVAAAPAVLETEAPEVPVAASPNPAENAHEQIAKIAYGYYAARGYQGGSQAEDWLRAEREYLAGSR